MPRYDYEPCDGKCDYCGGRFEVVQSMKDDALTACPMCDKPVRRLISASIGLKIPRSDTELRDLGFTKLKKRSDGAYENLTQRQGEPKIINPNEKMPLPPSITD